MVRRGLGATAGGTLVAVALTGSWTVVVVAVAVVLVMTVAVCWVVADPDRPARLALLLAAWQHTPDRRSVTGEPGTGPRG